MPEETICAFVTSKQGWIRRKLSEYADDRFAAVRRGDAVLDAGAERPLHFRAGRDGETAEGFFFRSPASIRPYFERTRGPLLVDALHAWSVRIGVDVADVKLRDFKARWGSCDAKGVICLNWRLSMLPLELRDYVLIHELCHRRRLGHSPAFWKEVALFCPNATALRHQLRAYAFLSLMYRKDRPARR